MQSIDEHPLVKWLLVLGGIATAVVMAVQGILYLEELERNTVLLHDEIVSSTDKLHDQIEERIKEKEALDDKWLELDRADHLRIIDIGTAARNDIKRLHDKIGVDGSLMYQLGLRDGQRLCEGR